MSHPGKAYERFCNKAWMGFCIMMMLHAPRLYAWFSKKEALLGKDAENHIINLQQERARRQAASGSSPFTSAERRWLSRSIGAITNVMIALSVISAAVLTAVALDPSIRYWIMTNVVNQHWFEVLQSWWQNTTPAQVLESLKP